MSDQFQQLKTLLFRPRHALNDLGKMATTHLKTIASDGFDAGLSSQIVSAAEHVQKAMPKTAPYEDVRKVLKILSTSVKDFDTACNDHILVGSDVAQAATELRKQVLQLKPLMEELPDDSQLTTSEERDKRKQEKASGLLVEGDDRTKAVVDQYYQRTAKLPASFKQNGGVLLTRNPLVVIGVYGPTVDKLRSHGVVITEFAEGYYVFENQLLLGLDTAMLKNKHGVNPSNENAVFDFATDILSQYNAKAGKKLAFANEEARMFKGLLYFWMLPDRQLSMILSRVANIGEQWGFPTRQTMVNPERDDRNVTETKIEIIFKEALRGTDVRVIAEKVGLKPSLVAALMRGTEMPSETYEHRKTLNNAYREFFSNFVNQKRSIEKALKDVDDRDARLQRKHSLQKQKQRGG